MKRGKLGLGNSIYSSDKFGGLTVKNGRLINNRPDGQTGIAQAAEIKRSFKMAEKVSIVAKGTAMGECYDCD